LNRRNNVFAALALVAIGIVIGWALSNFAPGGSVPALGLIPADALATASPGPPTLPAPALPESESTTAPEAEAPAAVPSPERKPWPESARSFMDQADPDPALSRELETWLLRSVDTNLDRDSYEVESITCRGNSCQILSIGRRANGGPAWSKVFAPILSDLGDASIRHPATQAELEPRIQSIWMVPKSREEPGLISLISFN
jgi:hypothetical protein